MILELVCHQSVSPRRRHMLRFNELASRHQEGPKTFGRCEAWLSAKKV